ncbi:MAG: MBL fold metallo-hydrolase [Clostridia bacterium]|nr:MBL fold metallo-hydrolase [Clostridia bacterium]
MLYRISEDIFKLEVPFYNIYTAVFFVKTQKGFAIIDAADSEADAENYILPALRELGISEDRVTAILLTHTHGDHVGGTPQLAKQCKNAYIYGFARPCVPFDVSRFVALCDGDIIDESIKAVALEGHDLSCGGFLHIPSKTLLSGDSLQLYGLDVYALGVRSPKLYFESLNKLKNMEINNILASHDFVPLGSVAAGKEEVKKYIKCAEECLNDMISFVKAKNKEGVTNIFKIQEMFISSRQNTYENFPTANFHNIIEKIKNM